MVLRLFFGFEYVGHMTIPASFIFGFGAFFQLIYMTDSAISLGGGDFKGFEGTMALITFDHGYTMG
jgi:hypothetical protein